MAIDQDSPVQAPELPKADMDRMNSMAVELCRHLHRLPEGLLGRVCQRLGQITAGLVCSLGQALNMLTTIDLIKYDTPHLGPRIQLMLSQLEFKLNVEKQYKDGIDKMMRLYSMDGVRKSKQDAEQRMIESNQKIQLLKQALKRYEDVNVQLADDEEDGK
jgi:Hr1 repeat